MNKISKDDLFIGGLYHNRTFHDIYYRIVDIKKEKYIVFDYWLRNNKLVSPEIHYLDYEYLSKIFILLN